MPRYDDFNEDDDEEARLLLDEEPASDSPEPDSTPIDPDLPSGSRLASDDPIGIYLKEMSRVPLLAADEEMEVAIRIEKGRRARRKVDSLQGRSTAFDRRKYNPVIEDGILAREQLIKANTRLVVSIAKRFMGRGVAFLDLIQEGNLGFIKAV